MADINPTQRSLFDLAESAAPAPGSAESQRIRSAQRKADGLCIRCVNRAVPGRVVCAECAAKRREMYKERRRNGQCYMCLSPAEEGKTYCEKHLRQARRMSRRRKAAGACPRCAAPPKPGRVHCGACLDRERKRYPERYRRCKELGVCYACGERMPSKGKPICPHCRHKRAVKNLALRREVFIAYGGCRCICCGLEFIELLTIEHPDNDGAEHRRILGCKGGHSFYRALKRLGFPTSPKMVVMCFNCNVSRGMYGYCPCQRMRDREERQ